MSREKAKTTLKSKKLKDNIVTSCGLSSAYQALPLAYVWLNSRQCVRIKLVKPLMYDIDSVDVKLRSLVSKNNASLLITDTYDPADLNHYQFILVADDYKILDFEPLSNSSVLLVSKGYFEVKNVN